MANTFLVEYSNIGFQFVVSILEQALLGGHKIDKYKNTFYLKVQ